MPTATLETPIAPPEERFWKRYSPHGEAPLSISGSLAVHVLVGGALLLAGVYLASLLYKPDRSLPVEPVRLQIEGGGGGRPDGSTKGKAGGGLVENTGGALDKELEQAGLDEGERKPILEPVEAKKLEKVYDDPSRRFIAESTAAPVKAFAGLEQKIRSKLALADRPAAKGQGGTGEGGGQGSGKGKGKGGGTGEGTTATLSQREKRMLRWHMIFTANTGPEYLAQLKGLGAILAFPVSEGADPQYKVVRDLRPGGQLIDEDVSKIQRIYWIDDKPRSVNDIINALGLKIRPPGRFVAFMPEELEKKLFDMEKRYVEKVLRARFDEDRIDETRFRVVIRGGKYQPEIISVLLKR
jgi:hypothetical protein